MTKRARNGHGWTVSVLLSVAVAAGAQSLNETDKVTASDGAGGDRFGCSVDVSGDYAVVGAYADGDNGTKFGAAYVFHPIGLGG